MVRRNGSSRPARVPVAPIEGHLVGVLTAGSVTRNDRSTRRARGVHPTRHTIGHAGSAGRLLSIDVPNSARAALNGSGRHPPCPELGRPQAMGPGDAAGSAATDREAWLRSWNSVGGRPPHSAARYHVSQRCSVSGAGTTPLRFASSFIRFHDDLRDRSSLRNATGTRIGMTRAREPHCRVPSATVSPCPDAYVRRRRVAKPAVWGPRERQSLENSPTFHLSGSGKRSSMEVGD